VTHKSKLEENGIMPLILKINASKKHLLSTQKLRISNIILRKYYENQFK